ncbi:MAG: hypothetical protein KDD66_16445 [Bdellovibrionales bacterium]|nr:hypothetical protein [Bdellovibrionales bacterium]
MGRLAQLFFGFTLIFTTVSSPVVLFEQEAFALSPNSGSSAKSDDSKSTDLTWGEEARQPGHHEREELEELIDQICETYPELCDIARGILEGGNLLILSDEECRRRDINGETSIIYYEDGPVRRIAICAGVLNKMDLAARITLIHELLHVYLDKVDHAYLDIFEYILSLLVEQFPELNSDRELLIELLEDYEHVLIHQLLIEHLNDLLENDELTDAERDEIRENLERAIDMRYRFDLAARRIIEKIGERFTDARDRLRELEGVLEGLYDL